MSRSQAPSKTHIAPVQAPSSPLPATPQTTAEAAARLEALKQRYASVIGLAGPGLTTDEIMRMTRGED